MKRKFFYLVAVIIFLMSMCQFSWGRYLPGIALLLGMGLSTFQQDNTLQLEAKKRSTLLLSSAIILLGFGFNLLAILRVGVSGVGYTVITIFGTLGIGLLLGRIMKNRGNASLLVSVGTAICGGSAIAAIAPVIRSESDETALAMAAIFMLNAIGLILFPIIGHLAHFSQVDFGLFAALAIHDTSSVVGSCMSYGPQALMVGTTVKLVRALWIIPVTLMIAFYMSKRKGKMEGKVKKPWFIAGFIGTSLLITFFPFLQGIGSILKTGGESLFMVALYAIGYTVSWSRFKKVGVTLLIQAVILWVIVSVSVFFAICHHWIQL